MRRKNMKKLSAVFMAGIFAVSVAGCGDKTVEKVSTESTENTEAAAMAEEDNRSAEENTDTEEEAVELTLAEYEISFEDRSVQKNGPQILDWLEFEDYVERYYLPESIDLYIDADFYVGYTKPDVEVMTMGKQDGWYLIAVDVKSRYVKAEDFEKIGFKGTREEYEIQEGIAREEETKSGEVALTSEKPEPTPSEPVAVAKEPAADTPADTQPSEEKSDKYTPEETAERFKNAILAGGITWNPFLKEGGSWGTGFISRSDPESDAQAELEGMAYGDGAGNSNTDYYFEVTGFDENYIYITVWAE